ncbi:hypothetical protein L208DRAFT_119564 [Tricholoma matsutake]|nr:hypothetical protein L208DRAFT_119564 [Tricholoma matsutake 945]
MAVPLPVAKETRLEDNALSAILGYLILNAPSATAQHEVVKVIHSCKHDFRTLSELASSDHPSRPSFDKDKMDIMLTVQEAPKDHKAAKERALLRDGFKCVNDIRQFGIVHTECAHVVPESTYFDVSTTRTSSNEKDYAASVLAVLKRFGFDIENLNGPKVHSLYNVMTMQKDVHDWFDRLEMWFEATNVTNCYRVKAVYDYEYHKLPERITFTTPNHDTLPVPSPKLLALHAACAKVAHLSGAGEYIDKIDRDVEDLGVLSYDGASSSVLDHALLRSTSRLINVGA